MLKGLCKSDKYLCKFWELNFVIGLYLCTRSNDRIKNIYFKRALVLRFGFKYDNKSSIY